MNNSDSGEDLNERIARLERTRERHLQHAEHFERSGGPAALAASFVAMVQAKLEALYSSRDKSAEDEPAGRPKDGPSHD